MSRPFERKHGTRPGWGPPRPLAPAVLVHVESHATCGQVECPHCGAGPGQACVTSTWNEAVMPHMRRVRRRLEQLKGGE